MEEILCFTLGDKEFAFDSKAVDEIVDIDIYTHVPGTPDFIKGIMILRGRVLPILDLGIRIGLKLGEYGKGSIHDDISHVHTERQNKARPRLRVGTPGATRRGSNEGMRSYDAVYKLLIVSHDNKIIGILVDSIIGIINIKSNEDKKRDLKINAKNEFQLESFNFDGRIITLLNLERILDFKTGNS